MKKYWKFTTIIVVIVLSLGTFFVDAAMSEEQFPEFKIETKSGDATEIKPLVLEGGYADTSSMNYINTNVKITADGSVFHSRSFVDQIIGQPSTLIKEYQEKYRSFMRGKNGWESLYFEDDQFLAYADVDYNWNSGRPSDFTFIISVLNKLDGDTSSFSIKVPDAVKLENMHVEEVQLIGNELNVITQNYIQSDFSNGEKHIYTIDVSDQTIANHEAIIQVTSGQEDTYTDVQIIETSPTQANEEIILVKTEKRMIEDEEYMREEVVNKAYISYNLATKEKETINVPDLQLDSSGLSFFDGTTIYFTTFEGAELVVTPYSIEDNQIGQVSRIQLSNETDLVGGTVTTVKNGKMYVASTTDRESNWNIVVMVADLATGDTIYTGEVVVKEPSQAPESFELFVNEIFLR